MKTIFSQAGKFLDYLSKNLSRLKTIGQVLILFLFIMSLGGNGCQRGKAVELARRLIELDFKNISLRRDLNESDSLRVLDKIERDSLEVVIVDLKENAVMYEKTEKDLRVDLRQLKDSLMNIPTSYSYAFLQEEAYLYEGELEYPFNEPQVRNIHLDYLENKDLWFLNENLMEQIDNCKLIVDIQDDLMLKSKSESMAFSRQKNIYEEIIDNNEEEKELLVEEVDKEKGKKTIWKILTGIAIVALAVVGL
ncbi:unnamed protein product [marine sediment metagenome]|uniref:Uncharacterized protein n=1 Tax=marine sediment metagenome TaxID=412755 RepID=X0THG6_9ZZZZ